MASENYGPIDPSEVTTTPLVLDAEQEKLIERVNEFITQDLLREILVDMVSTPSASGEELALAQLLADRATEIGLASEVQVLGGTQANAVLTYRGSGDGPDLLLYAPIDTHTTGNEADDLPWAGTELREDMVPVATVEGDYVYGLGANNPKGHAACIVAAIEAVQRSGISLKGSVFAGFGAGGMPTNRRPTAASDQVDVGHGRGCTHLLERGYSPDFAIITKTNWVVSWEEVGISWFKLRIHGAMNYTGVRHFVNYDNPIVHAATVIEELEKWFPTYAANNTDGLVAPQASIGAIEGGWTYMPTFIPAACDLYIDVRVSPRTTLAEVRHQFNKAIDAITAAHPELRITTEMLVGVAGTRTDPRNWIIQSSLRAWEQIEGAPHAPRANQSGATDAAILRGHGIPTARVGMSRVPADAPMPDDFSRGMNVVSIPDMEKLTRHLVRVIVDTCTRTRQEVGL